MNGLDWEGRTMQQIALSRANLGKAAPRVRVPRYDPASLTPGIVHLGLGGFHRAHMARYTHELIERRPEARCWGIIGAGLQPGDIAMRDALVPQDGLYTLIERDGVGEAASVIGSLTEIIFAGASSAALLDAIDHANVRIVSLTVTENGYCLNRSSKRLDPTHATIAADLAAPEQPHSAVGIIVEAYRRRMAAGRRAFTALSCDNIQHNGDVLARAVLDFAGWRDPQLAAWIAERARFPNAMVDRITPLTTPEDIAGFAARYGYVDAWPVFCEPFSQWVIEDNFADRRPEWEEVGAQFVADVAPYESMKLRLLNASHLALAGLGRLAGYRYVDEAMRDGRLRNYMSALMDRETGPTLPPVPGIDLDAYKARLVERFANPAIKDTLDRINADAPLNLLVDPIRDRSQRGQSIELLALALAAWIRRVRGIDEAGASIEVRHPLAEMLRERAAEGGADPRPVLGIAQLFGELGASEILVATVGKYLAGLYALGAARTLAGAEAELCF